MSFYTSLTGMKAAQTDLATISNNVANVGSTGFKKSRAIFGDLFASAPTQTTKMIAGQGTHLNGVTQQFTPRDARGDRQDARPRGRRRRHVRRARQPAARRDELYAQRCLFGRRQSQCHRFDRRAAPAAAGRRERQRDEQRAVGAERLHAAAIETRQCQRHAVEHLDRHRRPCHRDLCRWHQRAARQGRDGELHVAGGAAPDRRRAFPVDR